MVFGDGRARENHTDGHVKLAGGNGGVVLAFEVFGDGAGGRLAFGAFGTQNILELHGCFGGRAGAGR